MVDGNLQEFIGTGAGASQGSFSGGKISGGEISWEWKKLHFERSFAINIMRHGAPLS